MAKTHGDIVDHSGYIAVAPSTTQAKESEYVGGWEKVENTRHHSSNPTGTPAK